MPDTPSDTLPVRARLHFDKEVSAHKFVAWAKKAERNPEMEEPKEDARHKAWVVHYDAPEQLEKASGQPQRNQSHPVRPEYKWHYGHWFSPMKPDFERCCVETHGDRLSHSQCGNKARYDTDHTGKPTRCKTHSREKLDERAAKMDAKIKADAALFHERVNRDKFNKEARALIEQIADGHNNPRGAAEDLLVKHGYRQDPDMDDEAF